MKEASKLVILSTAAAEEEDRSITEPENLDELDTVNSTTLVSLVARIGNTKLID